ncbi:AMP-binding protein [Candidatus Pristimantibacillus sp. PTI5]|uniref:AMP-binding protein n=1 Tax=Candidatus Pristimantibacillus sp. PTI5 TaxID=3400422 RepID=UPI003B01C5FA
MPTARDPSTIIRGTSQRIPDAVAITSGNESLTYAELNARANSLACKLRGCGVNRDMIFGLLVEWSLEMM